MTVNDTKNLMIRTKPLLAQVESLLEERDRLVTVLKLDPSSNDNYDLINQLNKVISNLSLIQLDIRKDMEGGSSGLINDFKALVKRYDTTIQPLEKDTYIDINDYRFQMDLGDNQQESRAGAGTSNANNNTQNNGTVKSVRFKDESEEDLRNELMGTRSFKPYRDDETQMDIEADSSSNGDSIDDMNNHQMFAKHQQQLLDQDQDLDVLHDSVKLQKNMGQNINEEIDSHLIMLNDLESGVDNSQVRLTSTNNRLSDFRTKVQENGSLITIITLTVILILLLVVLN